MRVVRVGATKYWFCFSFFLCVFLFVEYVNYKTQTKYKNNINLATRSEWNVKKHRFHCRVNEWQMSSFRAENFASALFAQISTIKMKCKTSTAQQTNYYF